MKRLLLFSHYNKYDRLSEHVVYLLNDMQKYYDDTVVISNSELSPTDTKRLKGLQSKIITRSNTGYDFAAWREGMLDLGWKKLAEYDSVTIMNDTCFGPVYSFDPVFERMESKKLDFWGIISHRKVPASKTHNGVSVPEHLQSFFVTFNKNVVKSTVFQEFWSGITSHESVHDVINKYETRLTGLLADAGFSYDAFFNTADIHTNSDPNFTIYSPEKCLDAGMPLVKVKAFTHHRYPRYIVEKIVDQTEYPAELIENYFNEYTDPNQQLIMFDKIVSPSVTVKGAQKQKIGIHLHAFYMDVAEEFISRFSKWPFQFDLFITVSNDDLKNQVTEILSKHNVAVKEIVVLPNRGYAVIPWITVAQKFLSSYDLAGHFHTKKDTHMDEWVGKVWTGDLIKMLVDSADGIVDNFAVNNKLGIVVPDIPRHPRYLGAEMHYDIGELRDIVVTLCLRMNIDPKYIVDIEKAIAYIYPYGMMYWYRPDALKPITELAFTEQEVPHGKLPDTTVLHAIERLFVYVAWSRGYDYKVSELKDYTSEFVTTLTVNKQSLLREHAIPAATVSLKGAIKIKLKRESKNIAKRLPAPVKTQIRALMAQRTKQSQRALEPATIKLFSHELSNTGGPRVAVDLFNQIKEDSVLKERFVPQLFIPEGSRIDKDFYNELQNENVVISKYSVNSLFFNKGDVVILNTIAHGEHMVAVVLDNLERGIIKHLYLYPHEYVVENYLSRPIAHKITKLMKQNKLTIYTSSIQTQQVYRDYFGENDQIKLMPNRIDIDESTLFARKKDDFDKIDFVVTGTPDARKGELDILYAFTSFYFNRYKGNENKYRDFTLTIVGLSDNFKDVYNKLYSDRVRAAAKALGDHVKLHGQVPEEKSLEIIKDSNVTILYSLYECLPRVVFDGLAYGHPVIRNDCSGAEEQLIDGVNGWKTNVEDWQGLVEAIDESLDKKKTSNQSLADMSQESMKIAKKYARAKYIVVDDIKDLTA